jgi:ATP-dependent DNA ligase
VGSIWRAPSPGLHLTIQSDLSAQARRSKKHGVNGLHSRKHDGEVQFYAFGVLVSDGEDIRRLPLLMRKTNLSR